MSATSIRLLKLGANGPEVPALGFGLMGLSYGCYGQTPTEEEQFAVLDRAHELGNRFWDTADLYGDGEALLGRWFKRTGKRDDIFLSTKFGFLKGKKAFEVDSSAEYYYMHHANPKTPIEQTMRALSELQAEGKIKHIGLSAVTSATLRRAVKIAPVAAVQTDYSPFTREIEGPDGTNLLSTCRELGIPVVAAMPLGRGLLTSSFSDGNIKGASGDMRTAMIPRFSDENREANMKLVGQFKALAKGKGCTTPQLALAWLLKQGDDILPIPGTKRIKYLEENWGALDVQLTEDDEAEIRRFVEGAELSGGTLPPQFQDWLFIDTVEEIDAGSV
ncbi:hypothetical protein ACHAQA_001485 [Verticillium albo-atrum]